MNREILSNQDFDKIYHNKNSASSSLNTSRKVGEAKTPKNSDMNINFDAFTVYPI